MRFACVALAVACLGLARAEDCKDDSFTGNGADYRGCLVSKPFFGSVHALQLRINCLLLAVCAETLSPERDYFGVDLR